MLTSFILVVNSTNKITWITYTQTAFLFLLDTVFNIILLEQTYSKPSRKAVPKQRNEAAYKLSSQTTSHVEMGREAGRKGREMTARGSMMVHDPTGEIVI